MISFIIPAYNAAKTIKRAIDSITNQQGTTLEYEIIIVDDGSTDETEEILKVYQCTIKNKSKNQIKYYKKENGGVASARNYGVAKATGQYIIFVDSDDYISETLLKDIEKYIYEDLELIKWNPIFVTDNGIELKRLQAIKFDTTKGENGFNNLFGKDVLIDCLWNYAIKKEIMIEFPEGTYHEDFGTMPLIILKANSMVSLDKYEYYYVQTESSIMRGNDIKKQRKKLEDILFHYDNLIKQSNLMDISKYTKENLAIFATNSLLVIVPELNGENKEFFTKELKARGISKNIKARNVKQLIKKILLSLKY